MIIIDYIINDYLFNSIIYKQNFVLILSNLMTTTIVLSLNF